MKWYWKITVDSDVKCLHFSVVAVVVEAEAAVAAEAAEEEAAAGVEILTMKEDMSVVMTDMKTTITDTGDI